MAEGSEMSLDRGCDTDAMNEYRQVRIDSRQFAVVVLAVLLAGGSRVNLPVVGSSPTPGAQE